MRYTTQKGPLFFLLDEMARKENFFVQRLSLSLFLTFFFPFNFFPALSLRWGSSCWQWCWQGKWKKKWKWKEGKKWEEEHKKHSYYRPTFPFSLRSFLLYNPCGCILIMGCFMSWRARQNRSVCVLYIKSFGITEVISQEFIVSFSSSSLYIFLISSLRFIIDYFILKPVLE